MTNTPSKEKYVTEVVFKKEVKGLNDKIDNVALSLTKTNERLERLAIAQANTTERLAIAQVNITERLERVESTMATKTDFNMMMDRIDYLIKQGSAFNQEERVQSLHLTEVRHQVADHEKRLVTLESSR